ncbi:asparagine synthetase B family protein [Sphingomonas sp. LT1P40]|uniref:asparagine synthetase B family protein n=1 Tax=Alteristakelama amylovorans TaxID=3096166 RepID=UPI002FCB6305
MSAICGVWQRDGQPDARAVVARMQRALMPYGIDREGAWDGGEIALGARLTRRLPEDRHDRQPLSGASGRYAMVADLRLDNRPELAESLGIAAERLKSMADSDVALAAWERWGSEAIPRLVGDFAIVVWDRDARVLHLARDPAGFRPIFFHGTRDRFAFATMGKGLHALPDVPIAADPGTAQRFLAVAPLPKGRSFFAGIERVGQGEHVTVRADGSLVRRDWYDWAAGRETRFARPDDYAEAMRELFDRAVRDRLRATTPVATHLSGGLDSGAVTASAAMQSDALTSYTHVPLPGVTLDAPEGRNPNEWALAAALAARYPNISHRAIDAAEREIGDDLDAHFLSHEIPALNLCNLVWVNAINRAARADGAGVLLGGFMGNMTVSHAGEGVLHGMLARGAMGDWVGEVGALVRNRQRSLRGALVESGSPFLPDTLVAALRRMLGRYQPRLEDYSAVRPDPALLDVLAADGHRTDPGIATARAASIRRVMTSHDTMGVMVKGDLARFGIEPRDPTSDRRLLDFCLSIPDSLFLREGQPRWIFHRAFGTRFPPETLAARAKGLQGADWPYRLRQAAPAIASELQRAHASPAADSLIDLPGLEDLAATPPQDTEISRETTLRWRTKLLRGVSVAHFLRKIEGGNA